MILYICQTLDGFIAKPDGSIDFLDQFNDLIANSNNDDIKNTYTNFMADIENVVEGYTTYKQLETMGYGDAYKGYNHYVLTNKHRDEKNDHVTRFVSFEELKELDLNSDSTFLVGGSKVITEAFRQKLVTKLIITQLPIFLGAGIKLFDNVTSEVDMTITNIISDENFYQVEYKIEYK